MVHRITAYLYDELHQACISKHDAFIHAMNCYKPRRQAAAYSDGLRAANLPRRAVKFETHGLCTKVERISD
eukprot:11577-Heterococcus_DN1.PRE.3